MRTTPSIARAVIASTALVSLTVAPTAALAQRRRVHPVASPAPASTEPSATPPSDASLAPVSIAPEPSPPPAPSETPIDLPSEDSPTTILYLRDGSILRGWVIDQAADRSVRFALAVTREVRTIAARDIATARTEASVSRQPDPTPAQISAEQTEWEIVPAAAPGRVPLLVSSEGAPLQIGNRSGTMHVVVVASGRYGGTRHYEQAQVSSLCTTPCTVYVRPGGLALGVLLGENSYMQNVLVPPSGARITLRPASVVGEYGGYAMIGIGAAVVLGGLIVVALAAPSVGSRYGTEWGLMGPGIGVTVAGAALVGGGIALYTSTAPRVVQSAPMQERAVLRTRPERLVVRAGVAPIPFGGAAVATLSF